MVLTRQSKRRKTLEVSLGTLGFVKHNFPDDVLRNVASFLPKTSAALFATLFSDPNDEGPSAASAAILSAFEEKDWETINFRDIGVDVRWQGYSEREEGLWDRLTDEDISRVLKVIDAKNNLKVLDQLPPTITRRGLIPLLGSVVLEELSLVHDSNVSANLSARAVLSVIDTILAKEDHSLKEFQLLRHYRAADPVLREFLQKHSNVLAKCSDCSACTFCVRGIPGRSCDGCRKSYCIRCVRAKGYTGVEFPCDMCGRHLCGECSAGEMSCFGCRTSQYSEPDMLATCNPH